MEESKACTCVIRKKSYQLVQNLLSYKVHTSEFAIRSDTSKVRVDNKSIHPFRTNLLIDVSKLLLCVSPINLVFIFFLEYHHFQPNGCLRLYF